MRKTIKNKPANTNDYVEVSENYQNMGDSAAPSAKVSAMPSISDTQSIMADRESRVSDLLNKMTTVNSYSGDSSSDMGEFTPLENPSLQVKKDLDNNVRSYQYTPPLLFQSPPHSAAAALGKNSIINYLPSGDDLGTPYSNYRMSYSAPANSSPSVTIVDESPSSSRLLEKINYMIRLLEEQQHEKTSNITEEFILYTFLGVFVIFVLDSFARSGKYVR